jgi:tRNA (Thr-GGU) A37 N-methylase
MSIFSTDHFGGVASMNVLKESLLEECLGGIEDFSHAEIIFYFGQSADEKGIPISRHPRGNKDWPTIGIFA